jgi:hypothetical protein
MSVKEYPDNSKDSLPDEELRHIGTYVEHHNQFLADTLLERPRPLAPKEGYTSISCRIIHDTDKAILVEILDEDTGRATEHWFPLSTLPFISRKKGYGIVNQEYTDIIHAANWIVEKRGL